MSPTVITILSLVSLSGLSGWFFSRSKKIETPVKAMLFVLYFWVSFFIELVIFAGLYHLGFLSDYF